MLLEFKKKSFNHIKKTYPYQPNKIKIHNEPPVNKESITYEDIQNDRTSQFEKDLNKYKDEFNDAMSLPIPPVPNFSDNEKDLPIGEMEKMIKEMTDKRNYDVELINRNISGNKADNWLKPQETSIKSEKFQQPPQIKDLNTKPQLDAIKKNVTWGENESVELTQNYADFNMDSDLFKKLKKVTGPGPNEIETIGEISLLKEDIKKINNKLEMLDDNIKIILDILKNKNKNEKL